jgi:protocatechuate 3,4-dioxygenase beta subunit
MKQSMSRRVAIRQTLALGGVAMASSLRSVLGQSSPLENLERATPGQIAGPFYPVMKPLDRDADLTVVRGSTNRAQGQVIHVVGQLRTLAGEPVREATIEIWQANMFGRYAHPSDRNPAPLDPNFEGYAVLRTDAMGRYRFKTIKPGAYPVPEEFSAAGRRPPHIHFDVTGRVDRLVTQLYFPGEALNEADSAFMAAGSARNGLVAAHTAPTGDVGRGELLFVWNITLAQG